jgi:hypothetical protein
MCEFNVLLIYLLFLNYKFHLFYVCSSLSDSHSERSAGAFRHIIILVLEEGCILNFFIYFFYLLKEQELLMIE